jgi:NAD dependent epimerase/dehydratase
MTKLSLVTGAGGFIGSHLVTALLHKGRRVRALARYNGKGEWGHLRDVPASLHDRLEVRLGDVTDPFFVRELVAGCGVVYHLAALIGIPYSYHAPASYVAVNAIGTMNVLEACRREGVGRVIVTSTSEVYGTARSTPMTEEHPLQAQSPYAASKIAADKLAESYFRSFDLPVVTLRPFNTYGPRQSARAIVPAVLSQALAGAQEVQVGNTEPRRDLTFVEDTARAFVLAADAQGLEGQVIHFGQGQAVSVGELARRCLDVVGSKARIVTSAERVRPDKSEVGLLLCDASRARAALGWAPEVLLDEGLRRTAEYIKSRPDRYPSRGYVI